MDNKILGGLYFNDTFFNTNMTLIVTLKDGSMQHGKLIYASANALQLGSNYETIFFKDIKNIKRAAISEIVSEAVGDIAKCNKKIDQFIKRIADVATKKMEDYDYAKAEYADGLVEIEALYELNSMNIVAKHTDGFYWDATEKHKCLYYKTKDKDTFIRVPLKDKPANYPAIEPEPVLNEDGSVAYEQQKMVFGKKDSHG